MGIERWGMSWSRYLCTVRTKLQFLRILSSVFLLERQATRYTSASYFPALTESQVESKVAEIRPICGQGPFPGPWRI
jgi:hypothetical protein